MPLPYIITLYSGQKFQHAVCSDVSYVLVFRMAFEAAKLLHFLLSLPNFTPQQASLFNRAFWVILESLLDAVTHIQAVLCACFIFLNPAAMKDLKPIYSIHIQYITCVNKQILAAPCYNSTCVV